MLRIKCWSINKAIHKGLQSVFILQQVDILSIPLCSLFNATTVMAVDAAVLPQLGINGWSSSIKLVCRFFRIVGL